MTTLGSAHRLQRLYRLQTLTILHQRGSLIMSGKSKTLMRAPYFAPYPNRPLSRGNSLLFRVVLSV